MILDRYIMQLEGKMCSLPEKNGWTVCTSRNNIRHQFMRRNEYPDGMTSCSKATKTRVSSAAQTEIHLSNNLLMEKGRKLT